MYEENQAVAEDMTVMHTIKINLKREIFFMRLRIDQDKERFGMVYKNVPQPGYRAPEVVAAPVFTGVNNRGEKVDGSILLSTTSRQLPKSTTINHSIPTNKSAKQPSRPTSSSKHPHLDAFFAEELERYYIQMNRLHAVEAVQNPLYEQMCMQVQDLTAERDELLKCFGVESVKDIEDFWLPTPKYVRVDIDGKKEELKKKKEAEEAEEGE